MERIKAGDFSRNSFGQEDADYLPWREFNSDLLRDIAEELASQKVRETTDRKEVTARDLRDSGEMKEAVLNLVDDDFTEREFEALEGRSLAGLLSSFRNQNTDDVAKTGRWLLLEAIGRGSLAFRIFRSGNLRPTNDRRPEQQADRELARTYRHQKKPVCLVRCRKRPASGIIYCHCSWPAKERSCAPSLPLGGRESPAIAR